MSKARDLASGVVVDTKIAKSTVTAKGDLIVATASGTVVAQGVGLDGQVLTANSAQADGVQWTTLITDSTADIFMMMGA